MASLAESSLASVPLQDLAALQTRLLGARSAGTQPNVIDRTSPSLQYAGSLSGGAPPTRTEAASANDIAIPETNTNPTRLHASADAEAVIAESVDVDVSHAPPPRPTSARARMEAVAHLSPSQDAFRAMTRAETFHGFPGGDTQPMDSQVYRNYTESMAASKLATVTPIKAMQRETHETVNKTPHTYQEGETGFVDLEGAWRQRSPGGQTQTSGIDELLASPQTQFQVPDLPQRTTMPETPALAGHKRRHSGEMLSSDNTATTRKTPGYSSLFGAPSAPAALLSATQLFGQTQAPSSPVPDAPRSDPVLTRPSPNMRERISLSSPPAMRSSPIVAMPDAPGDPRDDYTSMQESDERRRLREEVEMRVLNEDDDFDMLVTQPREYDGMRRVMSDQALRSNKKLPAMIDLVTPATVRRKDGNVEFEFDQVSDDEPPMIEDDLQSGSGQNDEEHDQYDEFGQEVMRSQPNDVGDEMASEDGNSDSHDNEEDDQLRRPAVNNHEGCFAVPGGASDKAVPATQPSAVPDSQGQQTSHQYAKYMFSQPPTMSSFVPGSQYAGKTSQEQALLPRRSVPRSTAEAPLAKEVDRVPSSPPVPQASNTVPEGTAEASLVRQRMLAQFQNQQAESKQDYTDQEIPESDLPGPDLSRSNAARSLPAAESKSVPVPFSTARTHISNSNQSPHKPRLVNSNSQTSADTPRRRLGIRHFDSINNDSSQAAGVSGEDEVDIEGLMGEVMTAEDRAFIEAMGSPDKNTTVNRRRPSPVPARNVLQDAHDAGAAEEPLPQAKEPVSESRVADVQSSVVSEQPSKRRRLNRASASARMAMEDDATSQPKVEETIIASVEQLPPPGDGKSRALRSSPSKANELPVSTPENAAQPKGTQDSTRKREKAGAEAVSQLLATRKTRTQKTYGKGRRRVISEEEEEVPAKKKAKKEGGPRLSLKGKKRAAAEAEALLPEAMGDDDAVVEQGPEVPSAGGAVVDKLPVTAPNRTLALFKGSPSNFYPADFLGYLNSGRYYRIAFADTPPITLDAQHVRALDLRVGDQIKVDDREMRSKTWVVQGFGPVHEGTSGTDCFGHATVRVRAKNNRQSLADGQADDGEVVEVPINQIYITPSMWLAFDDRKFTPPTPSAAVPGRLNTPSTGFQTPDAETPGSRSRRSVTQSAKLRASLSGLREENLVPRAISSASSDFFTGMAFAISYSSNDAEKAEVTSLLRAHGGTILEFGFDEIFDVPNLEDTSAEGAETEGGLRLKPEYHDLGFVALIADRHSRRAKYMQALALGLPAVSGRWVTDSLAFASGSSGKERAVVPWERYLLAAGESAYLDGAVRSRMLTPYNATRTKLSETIAKRERLLEGEGVLIVASSKKGKGVWERRKAYAFLTLALGAGAVRRVADIAEARAVVVDEGAEGEWRWVYVDGSVTEAAAALGAEARGKKRKRVVGGVVSVAKENVKAMSAVAMDGRVRVVNDEFVVQSLIFGGLVD